ncbi:hypothetical protein RND64_00200 [Gordonia sp. w5E2]|uniref:hypothetical protein n=1 Tax=Gordonia TaxID=2053 RepID=UPI00128ECDB3|nr:hypothetical protein [Gordonia jacobaea]
MHVKSGGINVAVVEESGCDTPLLISTKRIESNNALPDTARFADLIDRFRQHLSPMGVNAVAILQTRAFSNLKYSAAFNRVFAICAVLQGASALHIDATTYTTNAVGASMSLEANQLKQFDYKTLGVTEAPTYWTTGMAEASAVSVYALKALR